MPYSKHGMFGENDGGVKVVKVVGDSVERSLVGKEVRVGVFTLMEFFLMHVGLVMSMLISGAALGVVTLMTQCSAVEAFAVSHFDEVVTTVHVTMLMTASAFLSLPLNILTYWKGDFEGRSVTVYRTFFYCTVGVAATQGFCCAVLVLFANYSLVAIRFKPVLRQGLYVKCGVLIFLSAFTYYISSWTSALVLLFWLFDWLGFGNAVSRIATVLDQTSIVVDNTLSESKNDQKREEKEKFFDCVLHQETLPGLRYEAQTLVGVSMIDVPTGILEKMMYRDRIMENQADFRRWAHVGDAAVKLALTRDMQKKGFTVGEISCATQTMTSRNFFCNMVKDSAWVQENMRELQGTISNSICAEFVEVLYGLSYVFTYAEGKNGLWSRDMADALRVFETRHRRIA